MSTVSAVLGAARETGNSTSQQVHPMEAMSANETVVEQRRRSGRAMGGAQGVIIATSLDASSPQQCRSVAALAVLNKACTSQAFSRQPQGASFAFLPSMCGAHRFDNCGSCRTAVKFLLL